MDDLKFGFGSAEWMLTKKKKKIRVMGGGH